MISLDKLKILTPLQKLPKNVGDLGKLIVAKGFKKSPKVQKSPTLDTLSVRHDRSIFCRGDDIDGQVVHFASWKPFLKLVYQRKE